MSTFNRGAVRPFIPRMSDYKNVSFFRASPPETRTDNVKQTLSELAQTFNQSNPLQPFKGSLLVGVQHMLATTADMFSVLKAQGLEDAIVTGKSYSTHPPSARKLTRMGFEVIPESKQIGYGHFNDSMRDATHSVWNRALQKIKKKKYELLITLDDGADLLLTTHPKLFNGLYNKPDTIVGIEQTRGGSNRSVFHGLPFPIINVAGSCIKNLIEYRKVAKIVAQKVSTIVKKEIEPQLSKKPTVGIIGNGAMGKALIEKLTAEGYRVFFHDKNRHRRDLTLKTIHYPEPGLLIMSADIVIGCTGEDVTASSPVLDAFLYSTQKKWLISTGSKDMEFNTLLHLIQNQTKQPGQTPDPLQDIHYTNGMGAQLTIVKGGFPVNFDNSEHSVPPEDIWPTRAALLLACTMSANLHHTSNPILQTARVLKLDPQGQLAILKKYQQYNPDSDCLKFVSKWSDQEILEYIKSHSEGEEVSIEKEKSISFKR